MSIVDRLRSSLRRRRVTSVLLICFSATLSILIVLNTVYEISATGQVLIFTGILTLLSGLYYAWGSFSSPPADEIIRYLDRRYPFLEDSSGLLVTRPDSGLEKWQYLKIKELAEKNSDQIRLPNRMLIRSSVFSGILLMISLAISLTQVPSGNLDIPETSYRELAPQGELVPGKMPKPEIESLEILISPPEYTGLDTRISETGNLTAEAMSDLQWTVKVSGEADRAELIFNDRSSLEMKKNGSSFSAAAEVTNRQIYRLAISNRDTTIYSDYYGISVTDDTPPGFMFTSPEKVRTVVTGLKRELPVDLRIIDDYGVSSVSLNLTLASGSGESVRFRERTTEFDRLSGVGTDTVRAQIVLNADSLQMEPGDELYFNVNATDNHPDGQNGRSQTYMMVVRDTTQSRQVMAGSIVVDLLPEDFRSQRQIIIDTENLIEEKNSLSEEEFRSRSRRIGQDQQMLRLDFGNYLGMENEAAGSSGNLSGESGGDDHGHDHDDGDGEMEVPEEEHDHGGELDGEGQQHQLSDAASVIPDQFFHDHGSPEMNTLFAESPRALLQASLSEMFRAQQYLQLDQPEMALPYEYRALELLQAAQQSERRYVRRAGYEGIPIPVEEKRLTGTFDDFASPGSEYSAERKTGPLSQAERLIREADNLSEDHFDRLYALVQMTDISEGDKLYLLNRMNRLSEDGGNESARLQVLLRLSELNRQQRRDPSPLRRPVLNPGSELR